MHLLKLSGTSQMSLKNNLIRFHFNLGYMSPELRRYTPPPHQKHPSAFWKHHLESLLLAWYEKTHNRWVSGNESCSSSWYFTKQSSRSHCQGRRHRTEPALITSEEFPITLTHGQFQQRWETYQRTWNKCMFPKKVCYLTCTRSQETAYSLCVLFHSFQCTCYHCGR